MRAAAALALAGLLTAPSTVAADSTALARLTPMQAAYARVDGYTARFVRQEVVGGELRPREEALLKFRRPGSFYLRWVGGPPTGREVLFVPGRHDDRVLVREPGFLTGLVTLVMAPDSPRVLRESRHPVSDTGIGRLIDLILENARRAAAAGDLRVLDRGTIDGPDGPELRLEAILPRDSARGYYCYRLELAVAASHGLPVLARIHDWDDRVVAEYAFRELRLNPTFGPRDFDRKNPEYGFRGPTIEW